MSEHTFVTVKHENRTRVVRSSLSTLSYLPLRSTRTP